METDNGYRITNNIVVTLNQLYHILSSESISDTCIDSNTNLCVPENCNSAQWSNWIFSL